MKFCPEPEPRAVPYDKSWICRKYRILNEQERVLRKYSTFIVYIAFAEIN